MARRRANDLVAFGVGLGILWALTWGVRSRAGIAGLGLINLDGLGAVAPGGLRALMTQLAARGAAPAPAAASVAPAASTPAASAAATSPAVAAAAAAVSAAAAASSSSSALLLKQEDVDAGSRDKSSSRDHASSVIGTGMMAAGAPGRASSLSLEKRAGPALMALAQAATLVVPRSTAYVMPPATAVSAIQRVPTQVQTLAMSILRGERNLRKLEFWK